jgi:hypothetical protein
LGGKKVELVVAKAFRSINSCLFAIRFRYLERHLASVGKRNGGDYQKWIEKGYRRSSDPEVKSSIGASS